MQAHQLLARGPLVDSDPQGSLTISCGWDPDALEGRTLYEAMVLAPGHPEHHPLDILEPESGLGLVPANLLLAGADLELNAPGLEGQGRYALAR